MAQLAVKSDPLALVGLRVVGDFHDRHRFYGRVGTIVGVDHAANEPTPQGR
jgi:hypothetical protein